jgi:chorismate mutase
MLDLSELRVRLDQATERIVSRLKDRSRFPLNQTVYRPDAVPIVGRGGLSFFEFSLQGLEAYHASLGRYAYPDQHLLVGAVQTASPVTRRVSRPSLPKLEITIRDDLLAFYQRLLPELCGPADDPDTYGETVYLDADLIQLINERINVGRYVAQSKADQDPTIFGLCQDASQLTSKLRDSGREETLIATARGVATRYGLDPAIAEKVFRWIVEETLQVEVAYLQQLAAQRG